MDDPATETSGNQSSRDESPANDYELGSSGDNAGDLRRVLDELFPAEAQDENLQPIIRDLSTRIEQGEDLGDITTLLLSVRKRWSGPLPSPEHLAGYEDVLQGLADRIVSMWERQQAHRIQMESSGLEIDRRVVTADIIQSFLGTVLSFASAMAFLFVGAWIIAKGHWQIGLPFGLLPSGILFSMFAFQFWPLVRRSRDNGTDDGNGAE